jgi:hypothetical protein
MAQPRACFRSVDWLDTVKNSEPKRRIKGSVGRIACARMLFALALHGIIPAMRGRVGNLIRIAALGADPTASIARRLPELPNSPCDL